MIRDGEEFPGLYGSLPRIPIVSRLRVRLAATNVYGRFYDQMCENLVNVNEFELIERQEPSSSKSGQVCIEHASLPQFPRHRATAISYW